MVRMRGRLDELGLPYSANPLKPKSPSSAAPPPLPQPTENDATVKHTGTPAVVQHHTAANDATAKHVPAATVKHAPAATVKRAPAATVKHASAGTVKNVPASTVKNAPAATVKHAPAATVKHAPAATVKHEPAATVKHEPAATVRKANEAPGLPTPVTQTALGTTAELIRDDDAIELDPGATAVDMPKWAQTSTSESPASSTIEVAEPIPKNSRWRPPKSTIRIQEESAMSNTAAHSTSPDASLKVPLWAQTGGAAPEDTLTAAISQQSGKPSKWGLGGPVTIAASSNEEPADPKVVLQSTGEVLRTTGSAARGSAASQTLSVPAWAKGGDDDDSDSDADGDDEDVDDNSIVIFENDSTHSAASFSVTQGAKADAGCASDSVGGADTKEDVVIKPKVEASGGASKTNATNGEPDDVAQSLARMRQRRQNMGLPPPLPAGTGTATSMAHQDKVDTTPKPAVEATSRSGDVATLCKTFADAAAQLAAAIDENNVDPAVLQTLTRCKPALQQLLKVASVPTSSVDKAESVSVSEDRMTSLLEKYSTMLVQKVTEKLSAK